MARKSTKTSHVLNLISGVSKDDDPKRDSETSTPVLSSPAKAGAENDSSLSELIQENLILTLQTENAVSEPDLTSSADSGLESTDLSAAEKVSGRSASDEESEPALLLVNVMEKLVFSRVPDLLEQLGGCTCDSCIMNAAALTLNDLPPRYMVVPPSGLDAMVSLNSAKYLSMVTVSATKACMEVKEHPCHSSDE